MAMANASVSWTNIPRDDREQDRLRLEQQLFGNISFERSSILLNEEDQERDEFEMDMDLNRDFSRHYDTGAANGFDPAVYDDEDEEESSFSLEYPRNPQNPELSIRYQPNDDVDRYSLVSDRRHRLNRDYSPSFNDNQDHEEGETRSTFAHHASAVTIRTGLSGRRRVDSPSGIEYDPDRDLDALVNGAANLSVFDEDRSMQNGNGRSSSEVKERSSRSEFTKRANGLGKQIDHERTRSAYPLPVSAPSFASPPAALKPRRAALASTANASTTRNAKSPTSAKPKPDISLKGVIPLSLATFPTRNATRVHLPDVTGITAAVASPFRNDISFKKVPSKSSKQPHSDYSRHQQQQSKQSTSGNDPSSSALESLSKRLRDIERENATSRRRVTELEMELENCKLEVANERTRLTDISRSINMDNSARVHWRSTSLPSRHKARPESSFNANREASFREVERRYKESVEEKEALEALVQSLRAHLTRLSEKVDAHQNLISDLRNMRHSDARQLAAKCSEIERLRGDVDRLQLDVDRLREVVEAGLEERRRAADEEREDSVIMGNTEPHQDDTVDEDEFDYDVLQQEQQFTRQQGDALSAVMEEEEPQSTRELQRANGSGRRMASSRFIQDAELERVRAEVEERRSQRSINASSSDKSLSRSAIRSPAMARNRPHISTPSRPLSRAETSSPSPRLGHSEPVPSTAVPASSSSTSAFATAAHVRERERRRDLRDAEQDCPASYASAQTLPQIRGGRLEKLFHSAPAHNKDTCRACHRKKRTRSSAVDPLNEAAAATINALDTSIRYTRASNSSNVGAATRKAGRRDASDDEVRFLEGDERFIREIAIRRGLPPQTVLARVLRELEDDFSHYKSIYIELADQYKEMDAASDMVKRNLLADHLREVIDVLEQKGDQIASLYDLLRFEDKRL